MIDLRLLRDNPDVVRASQVARGDDPDLVDAALDADARRRSSLAEFENLRAEQKSLGKQVAKAQGDEKQALLARTKQLAQDVKRHQATAAEAEQELDRVLYSIANVIAGAPAGGEEDFIEVKQVGTRRDFTAEGIEPKDHLELGEGLRAIDTKRGAKVSGARFYFLTGIGARR